MLKHALAFIAMLMSLPCLAGKPAGFAIYYGSGETADKFKPFDLIVLDSANADLLQALKRDGKTVLAYLSVGEVNSGRDYFRTVKDAGILLKENPNWPGAFQVDIRSPKWERLITDRLIPEILADGFDGIFIDTLDTPLELERREPKGLAGMKDAAQRIVQGLRSSFPSMKIMLNRAYGIAPAVAPSIDYILGESTCGTYNFKDKRYEPVAKESHQYETELLKGLKKANPELQVMTLDYCEDGDPRRVEIYNAQRANGFIPYVTTIGLDKISPPPDK